jgi:hypothetical protein
MDPAGADAIAATTSSNPTSPGAADRASAFLRPWGSCRPGADSAETVDRDPHHVARGRIVHRRELDVRAEIDARQPLQQFRRAALDEARAPVDHQVLLQAGRLDLASLDRKRNARIAGHVLQLALIRSEMTGNEVVSVQPNPDARHLRRTVAIERDEMGKRTRLDQAPSTLRQLHTLSLPYLLAGRQARDDRERRRHQERQADITVGVLGGMLLIDAVDDSLKHSLTELLPMSPPEYELGSAFIVSVEEVWRYLEPLVDAGLTSLCGLSSPQGGERGIARIGDSVKHHRDPQDNRIQAMTPASP